MSSHSHGLHAVEFPSRRYYRVLSDSYVAAACFARRFGLFFAGRPRTPLRVLCIMAFDLLHVRYKSRPLAISRVRLLADVLDYAASVNSALDRKRFDWRDCHRRRESIDKSGAGEIVHDFVRRLEIVEIRSRNVVRGPQACEAARIYREDVVRLNMAVLIAIALDLRNFDEGLKFLHHAEVDLLFRIVMLLQIVDDIVDYRKDLAGGLLSFLTASDLKSSLSQVERAAEVYSRLDAIVPVRGCCPFRVALVCVGRITEIVIRFARWKKSHRDAGIANRGD